MTAKRNTDAVPVTDRVLEAYFFVCRDPQSKALEKLTAAINASPELTKLIAENERMRKSLKAMYNAVFQLRGALVYINEMEEAQRILGEQS